MSKELIDKWQSQKDNSSSNRKIEKKLQKLKPDHQKAESVHNEVFEKMDCLDCANCCKSIPPIVSKRDTKRLAQHLNISTTQFSEKYLRIDNDGDTVINGSPCPFLLDDNKCEVYEARPTACRQYPHSGDLQFFKNISHHKRNAKYCPALFEIMKRLVEA